MSQRQASNSSGGSNGHYQAFNQDLSNHKDVISDDSEGMPGQSEKSAHLGSEIQIQRLTAQLTAAYSRIAALEEQLMTKRERQRQHLDL